MYGFLQRFRLKPIHFTISSPKVIYTRGFFHIELGAVEACQTLLDGGELKSTTMAGRWTILCIKGDIID